MSGIVTPIGPRSEIDVSSKVTLLDAGENSLLPATILLVDGRTLTAGFSKPS